MATTAAAILAGRSPARAPHPLVCARCADAARRTSGHNRSVEKLPGAARPLRRTVRPKFPASGRPRLPTCFFAASGDTARSRRSLSTAETFDRGAVVIARCADCCSTRIRREPTVGRRRTIGGRPATFSRTLSAWAWCRTCRASSRSARAARGFGEEEVRELVRLADRAASGGKKPSRRGSSPRVPPGVWPAPQSRRPGLSGRGGARRARAEPPRGALRALGPPPRRGGRVRVGDTPRAAAGRARRRRRSRGRPRSSPRCAPPSLRRCFAARAKATPRTADQPASPVGPRPHAPLRPRGVGPGGGRGGLAGSLCAPPTRAPVRPLRAPSRSGRGGWPSRSRRRRAGSTGCAGALPARARSKGAWQQGPWSEDKLAARVPRRRAGSGGRREREARTPRG